MQLTLSTSRVRQVDFTNPSGQVIYKTTHPNLGVRRTGTTTLSKIDPNDDPMDMRDRFNEIGQIEWRIISPSTFRLNGETMQSDEFLPARGISRRWVPFLLLHSRLGRSTYDRQRTFMGLDGCSYRWDMPKSRGVVLTRDDETRTEVARYHKGTLGIIGPRRKARLDVDPSVEHMLDLVVLTFVFVEKLRKDKEGG